MATKANRAVKKPEAPEVLWHGYFSLEEREAMIREAAYYRYLERGCAPGHDLDDWLAAEAELEFGRMAKTPAREVTKAKTEPPRILRRLLFLREWSRDEQTETEQIFP